MTRPFFHMPKLLYTLYITFFKNFFRRCWTLPQQALNDRCQTKATDLSKMPAAPHAPVFKLLKIAKVGARKRIRPRHNIYEATCAKQNEWL